MTDCNLYNPDNVFGRFKVVEFPTSFVGLWTTLELDVEENLNTSAYLKTMCESRLMKFDDAREISASHRAFTIFQKSEHVIEITFKPNNECISRAKLMKRFDTRFVFDLRLIKVDGIPCCNSEGHAETGRYYISGQFEYCNIKHSPKVIKYGEVIMNTKVKKYVRISNDSEHVSAKIRYIRLTGFDVSPEKFTLHPHSSKRLTIAVKPTCLKVGNILVFKIRNFHDVTDERPFEDENANDNFLTYTITTELKVIYHKNPKKIFVESLHKLEEKNPNYTYIDEELEVYSKRNKIAYNFLEISKSSYAKKPVTERFTTGKDQCYLDYSYIPKKNFCQNIKEKMTTFDLLDVIFIPFLTNFGRVGLNTYCDSEITIKNNTKTDITIKLLKDECILYTNDKIAEITIKLKSITETKITVFCLGFVEGNYKGTFEYSINNKYRRKYPYSLQVGNPTLMIMDKNLKFGMVTTEGFITSVPVRIYNNFNLEVDFRWDELTAEIPFDIIPLRGTVPKHSCKICDVIYAAKPTKSKVHEVDFVSQSKTTKIIPVELSMITRKLSIKFLQQAMLFKDIALNLKTVEKVKFENSSREICIFHVLEPLLPGIQIEPMSGTIRPKTIITFEITVKIPCILEFAFDVFVKINNKENVILPISGNVVEPKVLIHPKVIYMARVPCNMITYVPVTFQNTIALKAVVEILDTGDENIFDVYTAQGNEKQRVFRFVIEGGQTKTVFIKVCDIFRREYDMFIPFKINELLGPPTQNTLSTELQYYIGEYEQSYENNYKVKLKSLNRDISFCRIVGVITVPWIEFSLDKFEVDYIHNDKNTLEFTMSNVSKYYLHVTIQTSKLAPNFTLDIHTEGNQSIITEANIKFELDIKSKVILTLKFHPKGHGRFVSTALLYLDKHLTIPYFNLTFIGKRQTPLMTPSVYRIAFPPTHVGREICRFITVKMEGQSEQELFSCVSKEEPNLIVKIMGANIIEEQEELYTILTVKITLCCQVTYARNITLNFNHENGAGCDIEVSFCFTYCPLTLHTEAFVKAEENPYPYFPLNQQCELYEYLEYCSKFLEKWMFQQGFRRDLYPSIPDTFHAISSAISSVPTNTKSKGINVSYLNFVRRIAGPLMKHIRKISVTGVEESFKCVKEIHDTYREIIYLLRTRGAHLWILQARFLLSYDQFVIYSENVTPKCNADIILTQELLADTELFNRLNKQSWIDFILQSYKVFVMDSCFFECVCVSSQPRDIVKVLVDWYNEQIVSQHKNLRGNATPLKVLSNITKDLSDGIALVSTILNYCPFLKEHFALFCEINDESRDGNIIHNACLIIEAMNYLKLYFPLTSVDLLNPNFLQMLFLSIHLYVTLPMFKPKDVISFNPPLLRSSTRQVSISPSSQESLIFNYIVLNNTRNNFIVEKAASGDNGKKIFLSVKFIANFVQDENSILLVHGYNKTRIFDTYILFTLEASIGALNPYRKCKVTGPLYRPNKVDVLVSSPFQTSAIFQVYLTDTEPSIPVVFEEETKCKFYIRRLNLIDKEINLAGLPKETGQEVIEHKLFMQMICLSTQIGNSWIWFRSEVGEFFIRITTQPRWDLPVDTLQVKVRTWPIDPCSCGESCECYRTTVLLIPHRNELMVKSLRYALVENSTEVMMQVFDQLIESTTGKIILGMLLSEGGTNMSDVQHMLRSETSFCISSRSLLPRVDRVTLAHHTAALFPLAVTLPPSDTSEKHSIVFTSDCGMDIRTYRIVFIKSSENDELSNSFT